MRSSTACAALGSLGAHIPDLPEAYNPASVDNVVYGGANAVGGALVSDTGPGRNADGSWSLGAFVYDVFHDDPVNPKRKQPAPVTWGSEGRARVASPARQPEDPFIDYTQTAGWAAANNAI